MNLTISGHHLEVTPAIRDYVSEKLDRVKRHFDHVINMNAIMQVDKLDRQIVKHKEKTSDVHQGSGGLKHQATVNENTA